MDSLSKRAFSGIHRSPHHFVSLLTDSLSLSLSLCFFLLSFSRSLALTLSLSLSLPFIHPYAPTTLSFLVSHSLPIRGLAINLNLLLAVRTLSWKTQVSPYTINGNGLFIFLSASLHPPCAQPSSFVSFLPFSSLPLAITSTTVLYN